mmetsp:Transcript_23948/g.33500  ORF Transcript_23948/g.33500 Transcript_23948/m.33500 type:complete len:100 (+) Transcript_23948:912-1211(+)
MENKGIEEEEDAHDPFGLYHKALDKNISDFDDSNGGDRAAKERKERLWVIEDVIYCIPNGAGEKRNEEDINEQEKVVVPHELVMKLAVRQDARRLVKVP